ncbi:MAG: addiction module antidote protein [Gemmatimonadota bacterium]
MTKHPAVTRFDPVDYLDTPTDMAGYLEAALEDGDPQLLTAVLGDIARAQGMTEIARATGLGRESLYKALSATGNPEWSTVLRVISALGLTLKVVPTPTPRRSRTGKKAIRKGARP